MRLHLPLALRLHHAVNRNVQESRAPDGSDVRQEVLHDAFVAITRGPLVYATGLIDGYKTAECVLAPGSDALRALDGPPLAPVTVEMQLPNRAPILFEPWYGVGGRQDGIWRLSWLAVAPGDAGSPKNL